MRGDRTIRVWRFKDAPEEYRAQSQHGGDEDWVARIPAGYPDPSGVTWLWEGTPFGCCAVDELPQDDGSIIYIGAHA
jgi:hypothetical protein